MAIMQIRYLKKGAVWIAELVIEDTRYITAFFGRNKLYMMTLPAIVDPAMMEAFLARVRREIHGLVHHFKEGRDAEA